jgi:iron complex outermembrane recepter protein
MKTSVGRVSRWSAAVIGGVVAMLIVPTVMAEEQLEEITVTAQRRSENIQNVPIAVTAFTAEVLQQKGIGDIHALSNLTPNVNLDGGSPFSGDTSVLSASIRGIGQDDFAFNIDPGVGVYLDGVYLARTIGANQNLLDVDRIEILKGPQGTLFGRNTIGGAISIVTHTPGAEPRFVAMATGGRYNRRDFAFTADMPINSNVLTSLSVSSQVRDGYQRVIPYPSNSLAGSTPFLVDPQTAYPKSGTDSSDTHGGQNVQAIRGKLLWTASDTFQMTLSADYTHQNQSAFPVTITRVSTTPANLFGFLYNLCISTPLSVLNNPATNNLPFIAPPFVHDLNVTDGLCGPRAAGTGLAPGGAPLGGAGYVSGPGGNLLLSNAPRLYWNFANTQTGSIDTTYENGPSFAKYNAFGGSVTGDWTLNDSTHFKSITGYRQIIWDVGVGLDGTPESIQEVTDEQHQWQVSQEFQLGGKAIDNKLDYVGGLYYFKEVGYVHDFVPFQGLLYVFDAQNDVDTQAAAAFVHADYKITDMFGLTLGGRYSHEKKLFIGGQEDLNGFTYKLLGCNPPGASAALIGAPAFLTCQQALGFPSATQPLRYFPPDQQEQTFNIFTPTVGAQMHINNDMMAYLSWSKGFKSGGWTTRLSNPIPNGNQAVFGPEYDKTTELGLKSEWLNHRLLANAAIFYSQYSGIQLNFQQGASPVLHNAGDAILKGAELEIQSIFGAGWAVNFSAGYIDAYYTKIDPLVGIPLSSKLPKTPKYKVTFGPQYDIHLANSSTVRLATDLTYTASMVNDSLNTPSMFRPATRNLNAAIHYLSPSNMYEFIVGGTNLTNDRYITVGSINEAAGEETATYNRPREWYATVRVKLDSSK